MAILVILILEIIKKYEYSITRFVNPMKTGFKNPAMILGHLLTF